MAKMPFLVRILLILFLAGIIFAFFSAWKEWGRSKRIESEVEKLQMEAEQVGRENQTLSERIAYFSTDGFQEKEAKEKLGLKKADETAVVIEPNTPQKTEEIKQSESHVPDTDETEPNYRRWWNHFFVRIQ
jgi:cell division protein FtsB